MTMTLVPQEEEDDSLEPTRDPNAPVKLDDDQLRTIVANEVRQSVNHSTSQIALDQENALKYYEGEPFGNEVAGSSAVVLRDVAETIDWAMPGLLRAIFYTHEVVRYEDASPESEAAGHGRRQTQVINQLFLDALDGFRLAQGWAKAGLLEKFSAVKFWIERVTEPMVESAQGLTDLQLVQLYSTPGIELFESTEQNAVDPATGLPAVAYDVRYKRWRTFPRMRLELVPPEEFLCSRRATKLDQMIDFVAHQRRVTRSEVHSLGVPWELVSKLSTASSSEDMDGRATTRKEDELSSFNESVRRDRASQTVVLTESYIRVDYDGDGYSEMRRVLTGGEDAQVLLDHDYAEMHGFAGWCPIPMPHKLYGRGYYDVVADLQKIRSTLARQLLDNIYRMNNARHKMVAGEVDLDSYIDSAAGAPVIMDRLESMEPLEVPALPSWSFDALTYFEKVREQRTGIHPYSQESYAAGQNQTASGASQIFEAAMAQMQLLAQNFGEGLKDLFRVIPRMMKAAGMGPDRIKVGEEWIEYNPQEWPDDARVTVQVGLSPGQTEQRIQRLMLLLGLQKEAMAQFGPGYMVTPEQLFATAVRIVEQSGFQNPAGFFSSPEGKEYPQPSPSPEEIKVQSEAKNMQAQRTLELAKLDFDREKEEKQTARLERESLREHEREMARIAMEERVQRHATDRQYEAALIQQQTQLAKPSGAEGRSAAGNGPAVAADISERLEEVDPT